MYVKEMHIEVNQSLQKIAANITRKFFPEEIDWLLNKNMERFIQSCIKPKEDGSGAYDPESQMHLEALKPITISNYSLPAYKTGEDMYSSVLPWNYSYLLSDSSAIKTLCDGEATDSSVNEHILVLPFKKSHRVAAPYYTTVYITINGTIQANFAESAVQNDGSYFGFNSREQLYEVRSVLMHTLSDKRYRVYWERYMNRYYPKSIIIVSNSAITGEIRIDDITTIGNVYQDTKTISDINKEAKTVPNALTASHLVPTLKVTPFFGPSPQVPMSELAGTDLQVYTDKTYIVSNTTLTYIRKPKRISLILGHDCELAEDYHMKICDLTVEYIKKMIGDPNWQVKLQDNMQRTP